jgi:hypothetical protein
MASSLAPSHFPGGIWIDNSDWELAEDLAEVEFYGHCLNESDCTNLLKKWNERGKTHYPLPTWNEEQQIVVVDFIAYAPLHYTKDEKEAFAEMFKHSLNCARELFMSYDDRNHKDYVPPLGIYERRE